ncbi:beta-defensin 109-like [Lutra lutra]|uniref:beta-defensin 109-like n=1 Tax=Lutra lutra TaxID=9657 RepID=UPI0013F2D4F2|nr:putative beta-defensin 109B [Lontra canadensis]XP_047569962.1 beta-defensin 109-like [Lutra lutra]
MPLVFAGRSAMRLRGLLFLLLFMPLLSPVRSGLPSAENHCLNLSGICRRDICKLTEDQIGICKRRWRCCRAWWILIPIPTPLIYSDYQAPPKHKLK